jgi:hypothetical protein
MRMPLILAARSTDVFVGSFAIAAAILLVGGWVLLQWQRNRQQFSLMQQAIERGVRILPQGPPFWLLSLRQGLMILTLGIGLLIVGGIAWALGSGVRMPEDSTQPAVKTAVDAGTPATGPASLRETWPRLFPPPPPNPALEQWHAAQRQQAAGQVAMGCGLILLLLGIVRVSFSRTERRHTPDAAPMASESQAS